MARDRITITRPDTTGFAKTVHSGRPKLDAINADAMRSVGPPPPKHFAPEHQATQWHDEAIRPDVAADPAFDRAPNSDPSLSRLPAGDRDEEAENIDLVDLQGPPRSRGGRRLVQLSLRLRATVRHVPLLTELEARFIPREAVLRSAHASLPAIKIVPHYVAQVQEVSAGNEWGWRISLGVEPDILSKIASKIRNGNRAPRSALVLGQIEPIWFASLDQTISRLLK